MGAFRLWNARYTKRGTFKNARYTTNAHYKAHTQTGKQQRSGIAVRETGVRHVIGSLFNPFFPTVPTFAVRETASLGMMGAPRVPPLNPSETIVF